MLTYVRRKLWVGRKEAWLCTALLMCCLSLVDSSTVSLSPGSIGAALLGMSKIPEISSDYREVMKLCAQAKVEDKEMTEEEMQEALNEVNEALLQEGDGPDDLEDDTWMNAIPDPPDTYMTMDNPAKSFGLPSRRELRKGEGKPQMISRTMEKLRKLNKLAELRPDRLIRRWAWKIRVAVAEAEDSTCERP